MMTPLLRLFALNRGRGKFVAQADPEGQADTLYVYDVIVDSDEEADFWGGVSPGRFRNALFAMKAPEVHVRIDSPGGSVFAARAMQQALNDHGARVIAHVDGVAASAASLLAMQGDERIMAHGSSMMIHKSSTLAWGNEADMTKTAALLKQCDASLVETYAARTGQTPEDIASWMSAETWMFAADAVALGFADRAVEPKAKPSALAMTGGWDLSAYRNPQTIAGTPSPVAAPNEQPDQDRLARFAAVQALQSPGRRPTHPRTTTP